MSSETDDASFYDAPGGSNASDDDGATDYFQLPAEDAAKSVERVGDWSGRVGESDAALQSNSPPSTPSPAEDLPTPRIRSVRELSARSQNRYSLPEPIPAIPAIPEHFLAFGRRAKPVAQRQNSSITQRESPKRSRETSLQVYDIQRPGTSGGETTYSRNHASITRKPPPKQLDTRRKSFSATQVNKDALEKLESRSQQRKSADMNRLGRGKNEDLFLELADDQAGAESRVRPSSRNGRASSRLSFSGKRRSLPAETGLPSPADRRPKTSGHVTANRSYLQGDSTPSELQRHVDRYRATPSRASIAGEDAVSVSSRSRYGRSNRHEAVPERTTSLLADSSRSPEMPQYGRRRPSFGATAPRAAKAQSTYMSNKFQDRQSESQANSSDRKQSLPDSTTEESQPDDTVWDELDDLKSRIKKLEFTGKDSPTSRAVVSNETNERPRTATTAPTTIDSSPKYEKPQKAEQEPDAEPVSESKPTEQAVGGATTANIHPTLHAALAKAKTLLNGTLYRTLEATAADALQLVAMTGSAGPQGTAFSAAAIINGVTVSDRQVRRKADTMCRNLTDLCLALCEGKHEAPSILSSPVALETPDKSSPSLNYPRSSLDRNRSQSRISSRPISRLEARRTSILGSQAGSSLANSPMESGEDVSASEQESSPSLLKVPESRRLGRAGSRLQSSRLQRYEDAGDDEEPTVRPLSRAMTEASRSKPVGPREYSTPQQQRSPSLRESLVTRRANAVAYEGNRDLTRVSSLNSDSGGRRRYLDHSTPSVPEEESNGDDYHPVSQPKRRVTSLGQYGARRNTTELPNRATSLHQRRHVIVE